MLRNLNLNKFEEGSARKQQDQIKFKGVLVFYIATLFSLIVMCQYQVNEQKVFICQQVKCFLARVF
jgi:hypothetical protein